MFRIDSKTMESWLFHGTDSVDEVLRSSFKSCCSEFQAQQARAKLTRRHQIARGDSQLEAATASGDHAAGQEAPHLLGHGPKRCCSLRARAACLDCRVEPQHPIARPIVQLLPTRLGILFFSCEAQYASTVAAYVHAFPLFLDPLTQQRCA